MFISYIFYTLLQVSIQMYLIIYYYFILFEQDILSDEWNLLNIMMQSEQKTKKKKQWILFISILKILFALFIMQMCNKILLNAFPKKKKI